MKLKQTEKKVLTEEEKLADAQKRADAKKDAVVDVLEGFDKLPNAAHVRLPVVMALYACSAASVWRYLQDKRIPASRKFGPRVTAWNVGELRAALNA